jgi:L,D-peptidoglycan transpeptidase YkuD (ErfK/YbiS/YcfS/YnhG family)
VIRRRLVVLLTAVLLAAGLVAPGPVMAAGRPLPSYFSLDADVQQLVTVTSANWSNTRAWLRVWRQRDGEWRLVHGPVRVRLGWNAWVRGQKRRQSTGTTPAGQFTLNYVFGNRVNPGTSMRYRHVDGNDYWPYEPRDPATYNIYQPHKAKTTHWRKDYRERLSHFRYQYAYAVVLGFNLPHGVHWSAKRKQYVARTRADTRRGGGIFLHVQKTRYTAGCVAGPIKDVRWLVRWLDPSLKPRIVMGPTAWVKRRF